MILNICNKWLNTWLSLVTRNSLPSKVPHSMSSHRAARRSSSYGVQFWLPVTSANGFWLATLEPLRLMLFSLLKTPVIGVRLICFQGQPLLFLLWFLLWYVFRNIHHPGRSPLPLTPLTQAILIVSPTPFPIQWPKDINEILSFKNLEEEFLLL